MPTPNLKYNIVLPDGRNEVWSQEQMVAKGTNLFMKHPDVSVTEESAYDSTKQYGSDAKFKVSLNGQEEEWTADQWKEKGQKLFDKFPDAQVSVATPYTQPRDDAFAMQSMAASLKAGVTKPEIKVHDNNALFNAMHPQSAPSWLKETAEEMGVETPIPAVANAVERWKYALPAFDAKFVDNAYAQATDEKGEFDEQKFDSILQDKLDEDIQARAYVSWKRAKLSTIPYMEKQLETLSGEEKKDAKESIEAYKKQIEELTPQFKDVNKKQYAGMMAENQVSLDSIDDSMEGDYYENLRNLKQRYLSWGVDGAPRRDGDGDSSFNQQVTPGPMTISQQIQENETYAAARWFYDKAQDTLLLPVVGEYKKGQKWQTFKQGTVNRFTDIDEDGERTLGANQRVRQVETAINYRLRQVAEKLEAKAGSLSEEDLEKIDLRSILTDAEASLWEGFCASAKAESMRNMDTKGKSIADVAWGMVPFAAEMLLTRGFANAGSNAIKHFLLRGLVSTLGKVKTSSKVVQGLARYAGRYGVGLATRLTKAAIGTSLAPVSTQRFISEALIETDDEGKLKFGHAGANAVGWIRNFKEYYTEIAGEYYGKILGDVFHLTKLDDIYDAYIKSPITETGGRLLKAYNGVKWMNAVGWDGAGELIEEVEGVLIDRIAGDKDSWKQFWEKDNLMDLLIGFAPMSMLGAISSGYHEIRESRLNQKISDAEKAYRDAHGELGYTDEQWRRLFEGFMRQAYKRGSVEGVAESLREMERWYAERLGEKGLTEQEVKDRLTSSAELGRAILEEMAQYGAVTAVRQMENNNLRNTIVNETKNSKFWTEDEDGNHVSTANFVADKKGNTEFNDGERLFVIGTADSNGNVMVMNAEGKKSMVPEQQLKNVQNSEMDKWLTEERKRREDTVEKKKAAKERAEKTKQITAQVNANAKLSFKNGESTIEGVAIAMNNGRVMVDFGKEVTINGRTGQMLDFSIEEAGRALSTPIEMDADGERRAITFANSAYIDARKWEYNSFLRGKRFTLNGKNYLFDHIYRTKIEKGEAYFYVIAKDESGMLREFRLTDKEVDDLKPEEFSPAVAESQDSNADVDYSGAALPMRTEADGTQVVDEKALFDNDPEAWGRYNDTQRNDGGADSFEYLSNVALPTAMAELEQMQEARKTERDFDMRKTLDAEIAKKKARIQALETLRGKYIMEAIKPLNTDGTNVIVATRETILDVMRDAKCTDDEISTADMALAVDATIEGIFTRSNSAVFLVAEGIEDFDAARRVFTHEHQHKDTFETGLDFLLMATDITDEELTQAVSALSGTEFYSNQGRQKLADEAISYSVDHVYSMGGNVESVLRQSGVKSEKLINFIKNIQDERARAIKAGLSSARNNQHGGASLGVADSGNGEAQVGESAPLGEQGLGTPEGSNEESAEEVEPDFTPLEGVDDYVAENGNGEEIAERTDGGDTLFSVRTYEEGGRDAYVAELKRLVDAGEITQKDADDMLWQLDYAYNICKQYAGAKDDDGNPIYAPFAQWSQAEVVVGEDGKPYLSVIVPNSDYKRNIDFSRVCKKRRALDMVLNKMLANGSLEALETLRETDIALINWILQDNGLEVACALYFVDARRYNVGNMAETFANAYNSIIASRLLSGTEFTMDDLAFFNFSGSDAEELKTKGRPIHEMPVAEAVEKLNWSAFKSLMDNTGKKTVGGKIMKLIWNDIFDKNGKIKKNATLRHLKKLSHGDLVSSHSFEGVKAKEDAVLTLYNAQKGTGGPKASFGDMQYLNDIINSTHFDSKNIDKVYAEGGVRIQSFSDFVPRMIFDYMQMFAELSARKFPAHAYTKEELFVKLFGLTGLKVNMSLVPDVVADGRAPGLDADGNYVWCVEIKDEAGNVIRPAQTFSYDEAMKIQQAEGYSRNCGTIAVGISDAHILKMLSDPNIQMVIPYHKSSLNPIVAMMNNVDAFVDYTDSQNEKWIDPDAHKGSDGKVKKTPHFEFNGDLRKTGDVQKTIENYLAWCKKNELRPKFPMFVDNPNYYKLIEDFNLFDCVSGEYAPHSPVTMTFPTTDSAFGSFTDLVKRGLEEDTATAKEMDEKTTALLDTIENTIAHNQELRRQRIAEYDAKGYGEGRRKAAEKEYAESIAKDRIKEQQERMMTAVRSGASMRVDGDILAQRDALTLLGEDVTEYNQRILADSIDNMDKMDREMKAAQERRIDVAREDDGASFSISRSTRETIDAWGRKAVTDWNEEQSKFLSSYLESEYDTTSEQLAVARWYLNGRIVPTEDDEKCHQALKTAKRFKLDATKFASPMDIINQYGITETKEKPIDPDTVPTLHVAKRLGNGIVVYDVDETEESRQNMRKILNTHFGKDCSPWCLLQGDGNGNLTDDSKTYWYDRYNAYTKQVAFQNGKLIAFSANSTETRLWWDRQDNSHTNIPAIGKIKGDELGRSATMEYDPESGDLVKMSDKFKGDRKNGLRQMWEDTEDGDFLSWECEYKDGLANGAERSYWYNGNLREELTNKDGVPDGEKRIYFTDGKLSRVEHYKNGDFVGEQTSYYPNGNVKITETYGEEGRESAYTYREDSSMELKRITFFRKDKGTLGREVDQETKYNPDGSVSSKRQIYGWSIGKLEKYEVGGVRSRDHYDLANEGEFFWYPTFTNEYTLDGQVRSAKVFDQYDGNETGQYVFVNGEPIIFVADKQTKTRDVSVLDALQARELRNLESGMSAMGATAEEITELKDAILYGDTWDAPHKAQDIVRRINIDNGVDTESLEAKINVRRAFDMMNDVGIINNAIKKLEQGHWTEEDIIVKNGWESFICGEDDVIRDGDPFNEGASFSVAAGISYMEKPLKEIVAKSKDEVEKGKATIRLRAISKAREFLSRSNGDETLAHELALAEYKIIADKAHDDSSKANDAIDAKRVELLLHESIPFSQIDSFLDAMEESSAEYVTIVDTPEEWDRIISKNYNTPIGVLHLGANQEVKQFVKNRKGELGLLDSTLENPSLIAEVPSDHVAENEAPEEFSSYMFAKTFKQGDKKILYYTSVAISKDGKKVSISSSKRGRSTVKSAIIEGRIIKTSGLSGFTVVDSTSNESVQDASAATGLDSTYGKDTNTSENSKSSQENNNGASLSVSAKKEQPSLVALHNISEKNLRAAMRNGGLANPSIAIVDINKRGHDEFGGISLVLPSDLVNDAAGVWQDDIWSPIYPASKYNLSDAAYENLQSEIRKYTDNEDFIRQMASDIYGKKDKGVPLQWLFLQEKGIDATEYKHDNMPYYWASLISEFKTFANLKKALESNPESTWMRVPTNQIFSELIYAAHPELNADPNTPAEERMAHWKSIRDVYKTYKADYADENGNPKMDVLKSLFDKYAKLYKQHGDFDYVDTVNSAAMQVSHRNMWDEYEGWAEKKMQELGATSVIRDGHDRSGNARWIPDSAENASRVMNKKDIKGNSTFGGWGTFIAGISKKMNSIDSIRANKELLGHNEQYDALRDSFTDMATMVHDNNRDYDLWDGSASRLLASMVKSSASVESFLKSHGITLDEEELEQMKEFKKNAKERLSDYFEGKFDRPVRLSEFAGAIVPAKTDPELIEELQKYGLDVRTYNPNKEGDIWRAQKQIAKTEGISFAIGKARKEAMASRLSNKLTAMSDEQIQATIAEIEKMGEEAKNGGDSKLENTLLDWVLRGIVTLPDDKEKAMLTYNLAKRFNKPMASIDNLNRFIETYGAKAEQRDASKKLLDPDSVPEFTNKQVLSEVHGIVVYDVPDSREGQRAVRRVVDSHFGQDANPWCLISRLNDGDTLDSAWGYWKNYNGAGRQIAFQNGKLIAFMSSGTSTKQWWDRLDRPHNNVPLFVKFNTADKAKVSAQVRVQDNGNLSYDGMHTITDGNVEESFDGSGDIVDTRYTAERDGVKESVSISYTSMGGRKDNPVEQVKRGDLTSVAEIRRKNEVDVYGTASDGKRYKITWRRSMDDPGKWLLSQFTISIGGVTNHTYFDPEGNPTSGSRTAAEYLREHKTEIITEENYPKNNGHEVYRYNEDNVVITPMSNGKARIEIFPDITDTSNKIAGRYEGNGKVQFFIPGGADVQIEPDGTVSSFGNPVDEATAEQYRGYAEKVRPIIERAMNYSPRLADDVHAGKAVDKAEIITQIADYNERMLPDEKKTERALTNLRYLVDAFRKAKAKVSESASGASVQQLWPDQPADLVNLRKYYLDRFFGSNVESWNAEEERAEATRVLIALNNDRYLMQQVRDVNWVGNNLTDYVDGSYGWDSLETELFNIDGAKDDEFNRYLSCFLEARYYIAFTDYDVINDLVTEMEKMSKENPEFKEVYDKHESGEYTDDEFVQAIYDISKRKLMEYKSMVSGCLYTFEVDNLADDSHSAEWKEMRDIWMEYGRIVDNPNLSFDKYYAMANELTERLNAVETFESKMDIIDLKYNSFMSKVALEDPRLAEYIALFDFRDTDDLWERVGSVEEAISWLEDVGSVDPDLYSRLQAIPMPMMDEEEQKNAFKVIISEKYESLKEELNNNGGTGSSAPSLPAGVVGGNLAEGFDWEVSVDDANENAARNALLRGLINGDRQEQRAWIFDHATDASGIERRLDTHDDFLWAQFPGFNGDINKGILHSLASGAVSDEFGLIPIVMMEYIYAKAGSETLDDALNEIIENGIGDSNLKTLAMDRLRTINEIMDQPNWQDNMPSVDDVFSPLFNEIKYIVSQYESAAGEDSNRAMNVIAKALPGLIKGKQSGLHDARLDQMLEQYDATNDAMQFAESLDQHFSDIETKPWKEASARQEGGASFSIATNGYSQGVAGLITEYNEDIVIPFEEGMMSASDFVAYMRGLEDQVDKLVAKYGKNPEKMQKVEEMKRWLDELSALYKEKTGEVCHKDNIPTGKVSTEFVHDLFQKYNTEPYLQALFEKVSACEGNLGFSYKFKVLDRPGKELMGDIKFDRRFFNSAFNSDQTKAECILHEMIHGVTDYAITAVQRGVITDGAILHAVHDLSTIYDTISKDHSFNGEYGVQDIHEMVAELANPEFREKLEKKSLWTIVKTAIKTILDRFFSANGEAAKESNALTEVEDALDRILENYDIPTYHTAKALYGREYNAEGVDVSGDFTNLQNAIENESDETTTETERIQQVASRAEESSRTNFESVRRASENLSEAIGRPESDFMMDIYESLDDEARNTVIDKAPDRGWHIDDSVRSYLADLAWKGDEMSDREKAIFDDAKFALENELDADLSDDDARWIFWNTEHKDSDDLLDVAKTTIMADDLGFSPEMMSLREKMDDAEVESALFSIRNDAAQEYYSQALNVRTAFTEAHGDMYVSLRKMIEGIEKSTGRKMETFEDVLLALNQLSSKNFADKDAYIKNFLTPMWDAIHGILKTRKEKKLDSLIKYVQLKHGLERNEVFAKRDALTYHKEWYERMKKAITEMTDAEKDALVQKAQDAYNTAVLNGNAQQIAAAQRKLDEANYIKNTSEADHDVNYDSIKLEVESGTDAKYLELRKQDYSGVMAQFYQETDIPRQKGESREAYNKRVFESRIYKYDNLADAEAEAEAYCDVYEQSVGTDATDHLWETINAATKETLRHQRAAGMITAAQHKSLSDMFKYYVPLQGFKDDTDVDMYAYMNDKASSSFVSPIRRAKGRRSIADNPFGVIATAAESAIQQDNKNLAKQKLYFFVSNRANNGLAELSQCWYEDTGRKDANGKRIFQKVYPEITATMTKDEIDRAWEDLDAAMEAKRQAGVKVHKGKNGLDLKNIVVKTDKNNVPEHMVRVMVNGEEFDIIINGAPRAAQAVNGLLNAEVDDNVVKRWAERFNRLMSAVATSLNPDFVVSNLIRDLQFAELSTSVDLGRKANLIYNKWQAKLAIGRTLAFTISNRSKKVEEWLDKIDPQMSEDWKDFVSNGGPTGYTFLTNNKEYDKKLEKYVKANMGSKVANIIHEVYETFNDIMESVELRSRFAAYLTAKELGLPMEKRINAAKEVTLNFNTKGSGRVIGWEESAQFVTSNDPRVATMQRVAVCLLTLPVALKPLTMFYNAAIQGIRKQVSLFKKAPAKMASIFALQFALGALNAYFHAMYGGDDDNDVERMLAKTKSKYFDVPPYVRRTCYVIGTNNPDRFLRIPIPQEMVPFYAAGDIFITEMFSKTKNNPDSNPAAEIAEQFGELLPYNVPALLTNDGGVLNGIAESIGRGVAATSLPYSLMKNETFYGAPIHYENSYETDEVRKNKAHHKVVKNSKDPLYPMYVGVARGMNSITGGDDVRGGLINMYPDDIKYTVQTLAGGAGKFWVKVASTIGGVAHGEMPAIDDMPFVARIMTDTNEKNKNYHYNQLYRWYTQEMLPIQKEWDEQYFEQWKENHPEFEHLKKEEKKQAAPDPKEYMPEKVYNSWEYQAYLSIKDSIADKRKMKIKDIKILEDQLKKTTDPKERTVLEWELNIRKFKMVDDLNAYFRGEAPAKK